MLLTSTREGDDLYNNLIFVTTGFGIASVIVILPIASADSSFYSIY